MPNITPEEVRALREAASPGPLRLAQMDSALDPTELFRGYLERGSGPVWGVLVPEHPDTIDGWADRPQHGAVSCWTGNGPTSEANARLYLRAPDIADAYLTEHARAEAAETAIGAAIDTICGDARDSGPPLLVQLQHAVEGQTKQLADEIQRYEEQYARAEALAALLRKAAAPLNLAGVLLDDSDEWKAAAAAVVAHVDGVEPSAVLEGWALLDARRGGGLEPVEVDVLDPDVPPVDVKHFECRRCEWVGPKSALEHHMSGSLCPKCRIVLWDNGLPSTEARLVPPADDEVGRLRARVAELETSRARIMRKYLDLNRQRPSLPPRVAASDALAAMVAAVSEPLDCGHGLDCWDDERNVCTRCEAEQLRERVAELEAACELQQNDTTTLRRALTDSLEAAGYSEDPDMDWPRLPGVVAAMRARVAELEAIPGTATIEAAMKNIERLTGMLEVEWREGVPSAEDVEAHAARSAAWLIEDRGLGEVSPAILKVADGYIWMRDVSDLAPWRQVHDQIARAVPAGWEWQPVPWPVRGADDGAASGAEEVADEG